jgi:hypothetical protein
VASYSSAGLADYCSLCGDIDDRAVVVALVKRPESDRALCIRGAEGDTVGGRVEVLRTDVPSTRGFMPLMLRK